MNTRRKNDPVRVLAVKNTATKFSCTENHVRNIDLHGANTLESEEVKKFYELEYTRLKTAVELQPQLNK